LVHHSVQGCRPARLPPRARRATVVLNNFFNSGVALPPSFVGI
jgi:hypothetical protein